MNAPIYGAYLRCDGGEVHLGEAVVPAPERARDEALTEGEQGDVEGIDPRVRLMYLANEGDLEGLRELLDSGMDVNFRDIDNRTALHVAACQGFSDVVEFLLKNGAEIDLEDRWGSTASVSCLCLHNVDKIPADKIPATCCIYFRNMLMVPEQPLADAIHYKNHDVIKLLEKHGAQHLMAPMHVNNAREVPEYEIDPKELDFTNSVDITKIQNLDQDWYGSATNICLGMSIMIPVTEFDILLNRTSVCVWVFGLRMREGQWRGGELKYWKWIVIGFELASSLKINLQKSEISPIGETEDVDRATSLFGCKVGKIPTSYLGDFKLKDVYLTLFRIASHKNATVAELWEKEGGEGEFERFNLEDPSKIGSLSEKSPLIVESEGVSKEEKSNLTFGSYLLILTIYVCALPWVVFVYTTCKHGGMVLDRYLEEQMKQFDLQQGKFLCLVHKWNSNLVNDMESFMRTMESVSHLWLMSSMKWKAFRDELALLQKIRHPNVVQFLGAVTQSSPMMIVTEYLPKGDLHAFLKRKGALKTATAVKFALDIARNILRDDSGHLKVADFGVSKLLKVANTVKEDYPLICQETSCRYLAPEVFKNEAYDTKVDVFSFALILQEMIEGCPPFSAKPENEVPKVYAAQERPPFRAPSKLYSHGLKELIEECWNENPTKRPTFGQILTRLDRIYNHLGQKRRWKRLEKINMGRYWRYSYNLPSDCYGEANLGLSGIHGTFSYLTNRGYLVPPTTSTLMLLSLMDVKIVPGVCAVNKRFGKLMKLEVLIKPVGNEDIKEVMEVHASYASLTIEENRGGDRDSPTKRSFHLDKDHIASLNLSGLPTLKNFKALAWHGPDLGLNLPGLRLALILKLRLS
ncbi:Integrin-linked protein kinase 1 [Vitis vinifera]|uniref:Integrin-linked protein kinase 1 n=1 Tax=Vitis vinifera TaxID=29760 RepID=A0A438H3K3_VITVI|nr:Integrin-linked protein kinase 1 [Vitis vinifera]